MSEGRGPGRPPKRRVWSRQLPTPPDRRPPAPERDEAGLVRTREAAVALSRMKGPGLKAHIGIRVDACEGFEPYNRQRIRWTKHRMRELSELYGPEISAGVGATVRAAGWGHAFGNWVAAKAASAGDAGCANLAMSILAKASAEDRRAHELAQLEARLRARTVKPTDLGKALEAEGTESE